jgi:antitoxin component of RelBE/YafQ-DinJ toxin-antitoxin module
MADNKRVNFNCDPNVKRDALARLPKGVTLTDVLTAVLEQIADGRLVIKSRLSLERINPESTSDANPNSKPATATSDRAIPQS